MRIYQPYFDQKKKKKKKKSFNWGTSDEHRRWQRVREREMTSHFNITIRQALCSRGAQQAGAQSSAHRRGPFILSDVELREMLRARRTSWGAEPNWERPGDAAERVLLLELSPESSPAPSRPHHCCPETHSHSGAGSRCLSGSCRWRRGGRGSCWCWWGTGGPGYHGKPQSRVLSTSFHLALLECRSWPRF